MAMAVVRHGADAVGGIRDTGGDGGGSVTVETKTTTRERLTPRAASLQVLLHRGALALRSAATTTPGRLFAFFTCLYVLTYKGSLTAVDGMMMYQTTRSLADSGSLAIPPI